MCTEQVFSICHLGFVEPFLTGGFASDGSGGSLQHKHECCDLCYVMCACEKQNCKTKCHRYVWKCSRDFSHSASRVVKIAKITLNEVSLSFFFFSPKNLLIGCVSRGVIIASGFGKILRNQNSDGGFGLKKEMSVV